MGDSDYACEVCDVLPKNNPLFEGDYWMVSLSPDQGYLGRCYVTLKTHKSDLAELTDGEWNELKTVIQRYEQAVRKAFGATLFNWGCLMNNAYQASPAVPHIHWHVRPRYERPAELQGVTFTDPEFGHHYNREHKKIVSEDVLNAVHQALKMYL